MAARMSRKRTRPGEAAEVEDEATAPTAAAASSAPVAGPSAGRRSPRVAAVTKSAVVGEPGAGSGAGDGAGAATATATGAGSARGRRGAGAKGAKAVDWDAEGGGVDYAACFASVDDPTAWSCANCGTTEDLWLVLGDGSVRSRDFAVSHAQTLGSSLILKLNGDAHEALCARTGAAPPATHPLVAAALRAVTDRLTSIQGLSLESRVRVPAAPSPHSLASSPFPLSLL